MDWSSNSTPFFSMLGETKINGGRFMLSDPGGSVAPSSGDLNPTLITVNNVTPTVNVGANASIMPGNAVSRSGSFADPGADNPWTATVDYGDGSGSQSLTLNADNTFDLSHVYADPGDYRPVPDPDREADLKVLEWALDPGDAVLFDFRTVHGARGNAASSRRRVLSLRWVGDDARFAERPGRTSPPYPGHDMRAGQRLREDWFPVVWAESAKHLSPGGDAGL